MNPELLTVGQVAEWLNVSARTVNRWSDTGQLRTVVLPSGRKRFLATDVIKMREGVSDAAIPC